MRVFVSTDLPHRCIRLEDCENVPAHIHIGLPISTLTGPESDTELLRTLIKRSVDIGSCGAELVLYLKDGCPERWKVSFALHVEPNGSMSCRLDLQISDAIAEPEAIIGDLPDSFTAHQNYGFNEPYREFGTKPIAQGSDNRNSNTAETLFNAASAKSPDPGLITFAHVISSQTDAYKTMKCKDKIDKAASNLTSMGLSIVPRRRSSPVRQNSTSTSTPNPVVLTTAVIDSLRGLPLPNAARSIGVSVTAFKRACRRLGVRRWQYTRGPGRAAGGAHPASSPPAAPSEGGARRRSDSAENLSERTFIMPQPDPAAAVIDSSPAEEIAWAGGSPAGDSENSSADCAEEAAWANWAKKDAWAEEEGVSGEAVEDNDSLVLLLLAQKWQ